MIQTRQGMRWLSGRWRKERVLERSLSFASLLNKVVVEEVVVVSKCSISQSTHSPFHHQLLRHKEEPS